MNNLKIIALLKLAWNNKKNLLMIFLFFVVFLELGLRYFQPAPYEYYRNLKDFHIYNEDYLVGLAPNADTLLTDNKGLWQGHFTTNSLGMRGSREIDLTQTQVACLGDSVVMGFGVSDKEALCTILDEQKISGKEIQTLNLSIDALGSRGYAKRLKEVSDYTKLDVVLLFVSPNDFVMPIELQNRGILSDDEKDTNRYSNPDNLVFFKYRFLITQYSHLAHALLVATKQLLIRTQLLYVNISRDITAIDNLIQNEDKKGYEISTFEEKKNTLEQPVQSRQKKYKTGLVSASIKYIKEAFYRPSEKSYCEMEFTNMVLVEDPQQKLETDCPVPVPEFVKCQPRETTRENLKPLLEITKKYYQEMIDLSIEKKFVLVPVFLPIQDHTLYCTQAGLYSPIYDYALRARNFFSNKGIQSVELRKYIPQMCRRKSQKTGQYLRIREYYIAGDGHYTAEGNRWAADSLLKELNKLKNVF